MIHWLGILCTPVRLWVVLSLAAIGALCGVGALEESSAWLAPTWLDLTVALREEASPWVLATAVVSAAGMAPVSRRSATVAPWSARSGWPTIVRSVSVMMAAYLAGLALTGGTAAVLTAVRAPDADIDLLALLAIPAAAAVWITVGCAVGVAVPGGWNLLVALLVAGLLWVLPVLSGVNVQAISLVWGLPWPVLGDEFSPRVALVRLLFFIGLTGSLMAVAARSMRPISGPRAGARAIGTFSILLPPLILVAMVGVREPAPIQRVADPPVECAPLPSRPGSSVCVHGAHQQLLSPLTAHLGSLIELSPTAADLVLVEEAVSASEETSILALEARPVSFRVSDSRASEREIGSAVLSEVAREISGYYICMTQGSRSDQFVPEQQMLGTSAAEIVAHEIMARSGLDYQPAGWVEIGQLRTSLSLLSDVELAEWIEENSDRINNCTLDPRRFE